MDKWNGQRKRQIAHPYSDTKDDHKVNHNDGDVCSIVKSIVLLSDFCFPASFPGESKIFPSHCAETGARGQECCWMCSSLTEAPAYVDTYVPLVQVGVCLGVHVHLYLLHCEDQDKFFADCRQFCKQILIAVEGFKIWF